MLRPRLVRSTFCVVALSVFVLTATSISFLRTEASRAPSLPSVNSHTGGGADTTSTDAWTRDAAALAREGYGQLPLRFEPNVGQTDPRAKFLARGSGYTLFLTDTEAVISLRRGSRKDSKRNAAARTSAPPASYSVLRMRLKGAHERPEVTGLEELAGSTNYLRGSGPADWRTGVAGYAKVLYREIYQGVDLVYYGNQRRLEYDFRLAPGADPRAIRLAFAGHDAMRVDSHGDLLLRVAGVEVRQLKPFAYQEAADGRRVEVAARYTLSGRGEVRFALGSYDATRPLVIDPVLAYSTFLGGNSTDNGYGIDVDAAGNAYVTGSTVSSDFPTTAGSFQPTKRGATDAFVTKLNPSGSALVYSTFLGGANTDIGRKIFVDASGNAYVVGSTNSPDFPVTPTAYQKTKSGTYVFDNNIFVTKLNAAGDALLYSTYIGPLTDSASGNDIAVDADGNAYVTGLTYSTTYPTTPGAPQTAYGGGTTDAVVSKLNPTGSALLYSTYLGGSTTDAGNGIALDAANNAYVVGSTNSPNFPTTAGAFQTANRGGNTDEAFVTKLNATGTGLAYSTYLGGSTLDYGHSVAVDAAGSAYVTGYTYSPNFPTTPNAFQPFIGQISQSAVTIDAFVTKLNAAGSGLVYSTFLGGASGNDIGNDIRLDADNNACIVGQSNAGSGDYPTTPDAFQLNTVHDNDAVVTKLNTDGSALIYSTYIGGTGSTDTGAGIAVDRLGSIYITGTAIKDWPVTPGAFMTVDKVETEAYVSKFDLTQGYAITVSPAVRQVARGQSVAFDISVLGSGGFAGTVTLSTSTLPRGVSAAFNPPSVTGSGSSTLTLTAAGDALQETYPLTVKATTPVGPARSAPITLVVADSRPPVAYTVTDLGTLGGPASIAADVNTGGDVAGASSFDARNFGHAFLRTGGVLRDLGTLGGLASDALSLNDAGDVVGYSTVSFGAERPFLYRNGVLTELETLGNPNDYGGPDNAASDINNAGVIVGYSRLPDNQGAARCAVIYRNGVLSKLPAVGADSSALAINEAGDVVGAQRPGTSSYYNAFLYTNAGALTSLGTLMPAGQDGDSFATDINDAGQVVGSSQYAAGGAYGHAFLWQNGAMRDLGSLGGLESSARSINGAGVVVGYGDNANGSDFATHSGSRDRRAFVYRDGAMTNLNTVIDAASGWTLVEAQGINDAGQIVGKGVIGGKTHAFILNPVSTTPAPNSPPTVTLTSPAEGSSYNVPATVTLTADVADSDGTITAVDFYADTTHNGSPSKEWIGEVNAPPYTVEFTNGAAGEYSITAVATDDQGASTTSAPVRVTFNDPNAPVDVVWVEDAAPAGALLDGTGEAWNWVGANPAPFSGALAHQSATAAGLHQHYFYNATDRITAGADERLFTYVYLDPQSPPTEVMLQWYDGNWEHRAYWGANEINFGTNGTASRFYVGNLPQAGKWVRLEIPARLIGLSGRTLSGMAFTLNGGRATWDRAGKTAQPATPTPTPAPAGEVAWVDETTPAGAVLDGEDGWNWVGANPAPFSGALAHQSMTAVGLHQHYFYGATERLTVAAGERLFAYVYLDPQNPPSEVMLQWLDGSWEHRAYWGASSIGFGSEGTEGRRHMGALPPAGQWARLEVPAGLVGLEGRTLSGMAFTLYGGRATWDRAGKAAAQQPSPTPTPAGDVAWVDDGTPAGAALDGTGEGWNWLGANPAPFSGSLAHHSAAYAGMHQHYFYGATGRLTLGTGERLYAYVYLDPADPPTEVMLQWYDGSWEHRAYWGADNIELGAAGTAGRFYAGPLPAAGQWVRLEVPATSIGLEGRTLSGMAFTLHGGRAVWDAAGKSAP
jgi:probable HAF family extracellular repeat protein